MKKLINKVKSLIETKTVLTAGEFMKQVGYAFWITLIAGLFIILYLIR